MHFVLFGWLHCCIDNLGIEFTFCRHLIFFLFDFIHFQELQEKRDEKIRLMIKAIYPFECWPIPFGWQQNKP